MYSVCTVLGAHDLHAAVHRVDQASACWPTASTVGTAKPSHFSLQHSLPRWLLQWNDMLCHNAYIETSCMSAPCMSEVCGCVLMSPMTAQLHVTTPPHGHAHVYKHGRQSPSCGCLVQVLGTSAVPATGMWEMRCKEAAWMLPCHQGFDEFQRTSHSPLRHPVGGRGGIV